MTEEHRAGDVVDIRFTGSGVWHRAVLKGRIEKPVDSSPTKEWGVTLTEKLANHVIPEINIRPARVEDYEKPETVQLGTLKPGDWFKLGPRSSDTWCVLQLVSCGLNDVGVDHLDALERDHTIFVCKEESNALRAEPHDRDVYPIVVEDESHVVAIDITAETAVEKWGKAALTSVTGPHRGTMVWNEIVDENGDTWKPLFDDQFRLRGYKRYEA